MAQKLYFSDQYSFDTPEPPNACLICKGQGMLLAFNYVQFAEEQEPRFFGICPNCNANQTKLTEERLYKVFRERFEEGQAPSASPGSVEDRVAVIEKNMAELMKMVQKLMAGGKVEDPQAVQQNSARFAYQCNSAQQDHSNGSVTFSNCKVVPHPYAKHAAGVCNCSIPTGGYCPRCKVQKV